MGAKNSRGEFDLARVNPVANMRRFYAASVGHDLFGAAILTRCWGRIGRGGQMRHESFRDTALAIAGLELLESMKTRRGYKPRRA